MAPNQPFYGGQLNNGVAPVAGYSNSAPTSAPVSNGYETPASQVLPRVTPPTTNIPTGSSANYQQTAQYDTSGNLTGYKNNTTGVVTPAGTSSAGGTTSTGNAAADYNAGGSFTPPPTEDENYSKLLDRASGLITSINSGYNDKLNSANAASAARVNAGGLGGSSAGGEIYTAAQQPIIDQRNEDLGKVYQDIQTNADNLTASEKGLADSEASTAVAAQRQAKADALTSAQTSITALAKNGFDFNAAQVPGSPNYQTYQNLLTQVGGDPNVLNAMFALAQPAETVQSTYFTSDGAGGTTVNQVVQDPVTGKIQHLNYNIPGYSVPQNWTAQKIGTNGQLLTSPNFNSDPSNPENWTFMSIDPTNNGALTVVSSKGTTVNGIPVNENSTPADQTDASTADTAAKQAYASSVINSTATFSGVTDPTQSMTDIVANANIGAEGVANGIIKQEGGSPKGVVNNPGNIKFVGLAGQKDSGIAATDGGTFATYATPQAGKAAVTALVQNAADSGLSFQQFITKYKGLNTESTTTPTSIPGVPGLTSDQITKAQNYANDILNGTITSIASVPKGNIRDAVSALLSKGTGTDAASYSPLAASRFTTAANRIVNNYVNMPAYQLTAGGQLYLGRIAAAEQTPGSISDQDLLDSLTKLNTGGNAISDAQVSLITGGKSFSDTASVLNNKLKTGGVLSDDQRQQVQKLAQAIFKSYQAAYQPIYDQATKQLTDAGIPKPFWTIPDLNTLTAQSGLNTDTSGSGGGDIQSLAASKGFDYQAAKGAGYTDDEIQAEINSQ